MTTSAASQAFDTLELLEMILFQLPIKDLLLSQQVSKTWQGLINHSIKLQQALFFSPIRSPKVLLEHENRSFCLVVANSSKSTKGISCMSAQKTITVFRNPLLRPIFKAMQDTSRYAASKLALPPHWEQENASWRRMLLTQPAVFFTRSNVYLSGCTRPRVDLLNTGFDQAGFIAVQLELEYSSGKESMQMRCKVEWQHATMILKSNCQLLGVRAEMKAIRNK